MKNPLEGLQPGKEVCEICGKTFKTHTELDRHMENVHGNPEKTHTKPHTVDYGLLLYLRKFAAN